MTGFLALVRSKRVDSGKFLVVRVKSTGEALKGFLDVVVNSAGSKKQRLVRYVPWGLSFRASLDCVEVSPTIILRP